MVALLSEIVQRIDGCEPVKIVDENAFDYFSRVKSKIEGRKCVFIEDGKYIKDLDDSVSMVIMTPDLARKITGGRFGLCVTSNARGVFFELMSTYERNKGTTQRKTVIGKGCKISKTAVVSKSDVTIGDNVTIEDFVTIESNVAIGDNVSIQSGARIGSQDFNIYHYNGTTRRVYHGGKVLIGSNVLISCNVVIGQALYSYGETVIGDSTAIGAGTFVGHNATIGSCCVICANTLVAGFCTIGNGSRIFPGTTIRNSLNIGENVTVASGSVVIRNIEDDACVIGNPCRKFFKVKNPNE